MRYFIKLVFIPKEYDVVFVSSVYFNRGHNGENALFSKNMPLNELIFFSLNVWVQDCVNENKYNMKTKYKILNDIYLN